MRWTSSRLTPSAAMQWRSENQIDDSDHSHLGQLLTYASGLGAQKAIWIASGFSPEHLRALDELNRTASDGRKFFAVVLDAPARATSKNPVAKFTVALTPDRQKTPLGKAPARNRGGKYDRFARDIAPLLGARGFTPANSARVPARAHASERFFFGGYRDDAVSYNLSVEAGEIRVYLFHHGGHVSDRRALHDRLCSSPRAARCAAIPSGAILPSGAGAGRSLTPATCSGAPHSSMWRCAVSEQITAS